MVPSPLTALSTYWQTVVLLHVAVYLRATFYFKTLTCQLADLDLGTYLLVFFLLPACLVTFLNICVTHSLSVSIGDSPVHSGTTTLQKRCRILT